MTPETIRDYELDEGRSYTPAELAAILDSLAVDARMTHGEIKFQFDPGLDEAQRIYVVGYLKHNWMPAKYLNSLCALCDFKRDSDVHL